MPSNQIQKLKGGSFLESKSTQQYEGMVDITYKVTLKSWPKYYVVLLSELGTQEQVEISPQTVHLYEINRLYANIISNIQDSEVYDQVGYLSGVIGSYERSVCFKRKEPITVGTRCPRD